MNLKPKLVVPFVFFMLITPLLAQENADSLLFTRKIDSLSGEISRLKAGQRVLSREMESEYRRFETEIDSLNQQRELILRKLELRDIQLEDELKALSESVKQDMEEQVMERERVKKRFILSLLLLFVVVVILFIYFFYRNYLIERYVDERFLKVSMESDTRMDSLNQNILSRIKKLKKRNKRTEKDLQKTEKRFSKLRKKKK